MTTCWTARAVPRSTCHHLDAPTEHHLSPVVAPSTALRATSVALQVESAAARWFTAASPQVTVWDLWSWDPSSLVIWTVTWLFWPAVHVVETPVWSLSQAGTA